MRSFPLRTVAFVLAIAVPAAGAAAEPVGPAPAPIELLPAEQPAAEPEPIEPEPIEPEPIEQATTEPESPQPELPEPELTPADREALDFSARAEGTRDIGASAMVGTGLVTVGGVVLILAGFGATATAVKRSDCEVDFCFEKDRKIANAARVTLAGLAISTIGAVGFIASAAVYGVGNARVQRTRGGSVPTIALAPSQRGAALSLRGRF